MPLDRPNVVVVPVDLTGSRLGTDWLSADVELRPPAGWTTEEIRYRTAAFYCVPVEQVGQPYERVEELP